MDFSIKYRLNEEFVNQYKGRKPDWGFGGFGEIVYYRTYSRRNVDGSKEQWYQTIRRVVEGTMSVYKGIFEDKVLDRIAENMYEYMFSFKILPGGRGLWAMGTDLVHKKGLVESLSNCAFVSTFNSTDKAKPFAFQMDMSMLGVGMGLDTEASGRVFIHEPKKKGVFVVPDSREGWVESVYMLLSGYFNDSASIPLFVYNEIRPAGVPIKVFGGVSAGPGPLKELHKSLKELLENRKDEYLSKKDVVNIATLIGKAVVSGNVRRSAILMLDNKGSQDFIDLKNYEKNPERIEHGWVANHSFNMDTENEIDLESAVNNIVNNGEPGFLWMDRIRNYGRLVDGPSEVPDKAQGTNACGEMALESFEHCLLSEIFLNRISDFEDLKDASFYAYLYGKAVTLYLANSRWAESSEVIERNRRMGISFGGVAQFLGKNDMDTLIDWSDLIYGYLRTVDSVVSNTLEVPQSIKMTTIKPSGTVSYLSGATPGVHFPIGKYVEKRVRIAKSLTSLVSSLKAADIRYEEAINEPDTFVFFFPIDYSDSVIYSSMENQVEVAETLSKYFVDNQISLTVTIPKGEEAKVLDIVKNTTLKAITFFPEFTENIPQKPMEVIDEETFKNYLVPSIKLDYAVGEDSDGEKYCKTDYCEIRNFKEAIDVQALVGA